MQKWPSVGQYIRVCSTTDIEVPEKNETAGRQEIVNPKL